MRPADDRGTIAPSWAPAVLGLARRVIGPSAGSVRVALLPGESPAYGYEATGGLLTIVATDAVSACVALHDYLGASCGASVGWHTPLPLRIGHLPDTPPVRRSARVREGYYLNFCTFSYTTPWWGWAEWEREIDWMALHGVTMPLAVVGHEAALHLAYSRLGMADEDIRGFLGGPAYLPFHFMGCVERFAGPLPEAWIDTHLELGRRIIDRQRELGMTPVQPAFAGHIPASLAPSNVTRREWLGFETSFLDPADPLFRELGAAVVRARMDLFGTDHLYAADPFIEMIPVGAHPDYPALVGAATLGGMRQADPDAVWVLQAWPFSYQAEYWTEDRVRAFLTSIPDDRVLILDLWAEEDPQWTRLERFDGKAWIWCGLLNFGGRTDPIGNLPRLVRSIDDALAPTRAPVGLGLSMEGIHVDTAFFELAIAQRWTVVDDAGGWLDEFVRRRYRLDGAPGDSELTAAWRGLLATIHDTRARTSPESPRSVLTARPTYVPLATPGRTRSVIERQLEYDPALLAGAWERLIGAAERGEADAKGALGHDLVDVATAAMGPVADRCYLDLLDRTLADRAVDAGLLARFLGVFHDLDRLLAVRPEFTFEHWETQAARWGTTADEVALLRDNARRIVTVWDSPTRTRLDGYAARHWSGLVGGYHRARWEAWAGGLASWFVSPSEAQAELDQRLAAIAEDMLRYGVTTTPAQPRDVVRESRRLFRRYGAVLATAQPTAAAGTPETAA